MSVSKGIVFLYLAFITLSSLAQQQKNNVEQDFDIELTTEYRYFYNDAQFTGQKSHFPSLALQPEYKIKWNKGDDLINFKGFLRLDIDNERTHWDIRELYYQKIKNKWELSIGIKKIFWGVTESNHLVDIINQTDQIESFDGEEKLGQPLVQFSYNTDFGTFDLFYLPYFRKRTFAGKKGRLRFGQVIRRKDFAFESSAEKWHQDFAIRYSHFIGIVDLGLSHFYGTGREPLFSVNDQGNFNPFYPIINQTGIDMQVTHNAFLWKFESIYRSSKFQDFFAFVGGLEYTISNIKQSGIDFGIIGEYLYDERNDLTLSALQNDIFFGIRLALNDPQDTQILLGSIFDLDKSSKIYGLELSRRIGNSMKLELEARIFDNISNKEFILKNFKDDSFVRINLSKYF